MHAYTVFTSTCIVVGCAFVSQHALGERQVTLWTGADQSVTHPQTQPFTISGNIDDVVLTVDGNPCRRVETMQSPLGHIQPTVLTTEPPR